MKVLALSGSLRQASINAALLRATQQLAPPALDFTIFTGVGELPLFNPDLEADLPPAVRRLHGAVAEADALVIASPEYAHGVTAVIKNVLDWLVSFEPFVGKPVAVLNASPRAHHADAALRETLTTMSALIVGSASVTIPLLGAKLDDAGMVADPAIAAAITGCLAALQGIVAEASSSSLPQGPVSPWP